MSHSCPLCFHLPAPTPAAKQWKQSVDHGDFQGNLTWELVDLQVPEPQMPETTFEMGNHTLQSHPLGTSWAPMTCSVVF